MNFELRVVAGLCLLQIGIGGRARDVILVNLMTPDNENIRVHNITKRKYELCDTCIEKPVLSMVFAPTTTKTSAELYMELLCDVRRCLTEYEIQNRTLREEWIKVKSYVCGETTYELRYLDYDKQWDKEKPIEDVIQTWSAKMRRYLVLIDNMQIFTKNGRGTHHLRKLYVALSHAHHNNSMKEPAWALKVLGHTSYDTSLLYMNMQVK